MSEKAMHASISHMVCSNISFSSFNKKIMHTGDILLLKVRKESDAEKCFVSCDGVVNDNLTVLSTEDPNPNPANRVRRASFLSFNI